MPNQNKVFLSYLILSNFSESVTKLIKITSPADFPSLICRDMEVSCGFNQIQVTPVTQYSGKLGERVSVTSNSQA